MPIVDLLTNHDLKNVIINRLYALALCSDSKKFYFEFDLIKRADVFLFLTHGLDESMIFKIPAHPLVQQFPEKCFVWCDSDRPIPVLAGLFASLPLKLFDLKLHRTIFYLSRSNNLVNAPEIQSKNTAPQYLASFQGCLSSNLRKKIVALKFKSNNIYLEVTLPLWKVFIMGEGFDKKDAQVKKYARVMKNSKFIICPKGNGVSSYRLFEALQAGRIPVIISDQYVAPIVKNPSAVFMLFLKESNIRNLEEFLLENEKHFMKLTQNVKVVYDNNFSDRSKLHFIGEQLEDLITSSYIKTYADVQNNLNKVRRLIKIQSSINKIKLIATYILRSVKV